MMSLHSEAHHTHCWIQSHSYNLFSGFVFLAVALLPILLYPHPNLRKRCQEVTDFSKDLKKLSEDLLETMYASNGIGLSAPQVNVPRRIITVDITPNRSDPKVLINPTITRSDNLTLYEEGCLSFPGFYEKVKRPHQIEVQAQDVNGDKFTLQAEGVKAVCIQHECDHLDGKLFVDYVSKLRASRIHKKMVRGNKPK